MKAQRGEVRLGPPCDLVPVWGFETRLLESQLPAPLASPLTASSSLTVSASHLGGSCQVGLPSESLFVRHPRKQTFLFMQISKLI